MRIDLRAVVLIAVAGLTAQGFEEARDSITADEIRAHLRFLSQDDLAGRAPGTRGGDIAAEYVATQFMRVGLRPVDGRYFQDVPLIGVTVDTVATGLRFETDTTRLAAGYATDAVVWPGTEDDTVAVMGELVFVGYGIEAPEWSWDDYGPRDVSGKILVFLVGDPPAPPDEADSFDGRALTYYGRWTYKIEEARRRGAAGALIVHEAEAAGYAWDVVGSSWMGEQFRLAATGDTAAVPLQGWLHNEFARRMLDAAGLDLDELYVRAARRDFRPVATGVTVRAQVISDRRTVTTRNVLGYVPGKHPSRRDELVVYTAHYDHLGIGTPVDGDSIYNGAYDNASGVGLLLEVAEAFARLDPGTDRSVLFIATAAEEAGLLGSTYYTDHPPFPLEATVAALNVDGANLWGETDDVIVLGADRSTLGETFAARAEELGLIVKGDPAPERGSFFRSDHFPFARSGVPVLYVEHGLQFRGRPPGWGEELLTRYDAERYHRPGDDYDPEFDLAGAVQQGRLLFAVGYDVASAPERPRWYETDATANPATAQPDS